MVGSSNNGGRLATGKASIHAEEDGLTLVMEPQIIPGEGGRIVPSLHKQRGAVCLVHLGAREFGGIDQPVVGVCMWLGWSAPTQPC